MPGIGALTESQINAQLELTIQAMKEHNRKQHEQMKELLNERGMLIAENRELKEKLKEAESNKLLNAIISRFAK
jgi:cell shape-determining protein MreC